MPMKHVMEIDLEEAKAIQGGNDCSCNCNCSCDCGPNNSGSNANIECQNYLQQTLNSFRG